MKINFVKIFSKRLIPILGVLAFSFSVFGSAGAQTAASEPADCNGYSLDSGKGVCIDYLGNESGAPSCPTSGYTYPGTGTVCVKNSTGNQGGGGSVTIDPGCTADYPKADTDSSGKAVCYDLAGETSIPRNTSGGGTTPPTTTSSTTSGGTSFTEGPGGILIPSRGFGGIAGQTSVGSILMEIIQILLVLSGVIAIILIIIGGFQMIMSRGNEEQAKKGKQTLTYAIIGLIAIVMSFAIVRIVVGTITGGGVFGGTSATTSAGTSTSTSSGTGSTLPRN